MDIRHTYFQLPVEIARYAYHHKHQKALALYLYLKFYCDGVIKNNHPAFSQSSALPIMNDDRTFQKYMRQLLALNWVGYNVKSGCYFIRGFDEIRVAYGFKKRQAATIEFKDISHIQAYLVAVIIGSNINGQKYYWERGLGRRTAAMNKKGVAIQPGSSSTDSRPTYYGLSNAAIARELNCSVTRACELKQESEKLGYLWTKEHFEVIREMSKPDFAIRSILYEQDPSIRGKLIFKTRRRNRQLFIQLLQQQYDEIVPLVQFKRIVKFSRIITPQQKSLSALLTVQTLTPASSVAA